jgi:death-on-curing protein
MWSYGEDDLPTLAASLMFGICRNHPFVQGNKRTGYIAFVDFLELNGYTFIAPDTRSLAHSIIKVTKKKATEDQWVAVARQVIVPLESGLAFLRKLRKFHPLRRF